MTNETNEPSTSKGLTRKRSADKADHATGYHKQSKRFKLEGSGPFYRGDNLKCFLSGILFQINLLMLFMERGLKHGYTFMLGSEVEAAEKFDDVVFRYEQNGKIKFRFLQAKHSLKLKRITRNDLIRQISVQQQKLDFSIPSFFFYFQKFKTLNIDYLSGETEDFIICTNIDIDPQIQDNFYEIPLRHKIPDPLLTFEDKYGAKKFKLKPKTQLYEEIYHILLNVNSLYKDLVKMIGKSIDKDKRKCNTKNKTKDTQSEKDFQEILCIKHNIRLTQNRHWIMQNILDPKTIKKVKGIGNVVKFRNEFLESSKSELTKIFYDAYTKQWPGVTVDQIISKLKGQDIKVTKSLVEGISQTAGEIIRAENDNTQLEKHIKFFLEKLVFAVKIPPESQLKHIIQDDIAGYMDLADGELATSLVQTRLQDWLKLRNGKFLTHNDCRLLFKDLNNIVACLSQIGCTVRYKTIIDKYGCTWKNGEFMASVNDFFQNKGDENLLIVYYENDLLTKTKLMQLKKNAKCDEFIFSDMTDYICLFDTIACPVKALQSTVCDQMIIVLEDKKDVKNYIYIDDKTKKLLNSLLKLLTDKLHYHKKVLIVMPMTLRDKFYGEVSDLLNEVKFEEKWDRENSFEDLLPESQNKIRAQAKMSYAGCQVNVKELMSHSTWKVCGEVLSKLIQGVFEPKVKPKCLDKYNDEIKKYYVDRHIAFEGESINLKVMNDLANGIVIITGDCGLGKSILLSHLAEKTKEYQNESRTENNNMCIIKANLRDYIDWLQSGEEEITAINAAEFLYVLSNLDSLEGITSKEVRYDFTAEGKLTINKYVNANCEIPFSLKLFNYLYNNSKIILLLDSYDEIAPEYVKKVNNLLLMLQNMPIKRICIATRPYYIADKLVKALLGKNKQKYKKNVTCYKLLPLSKPEQETLLKQYCLEINVVPRIELKHLEEYCKNMHHVRIVKERPEVTDFLSSPQQLIMLAKIYKAEENENSNKKPLNRYTLYSKFVDLLFDDFIKKVYNSSGIFNLGPKEKKEREQKKNSFIKRHERFALLELFSHITPLPKELVPRTSSRTLLASLRKGEEKFGLLRSEVDEDGRPRFWHRTYAEYFAARCLADAVYPNHKKSSQYRTDIKDFAYQVMRYEGMSSLFHAFFNYRIVERTLDESKARNEILKRKRKRNDGHLNNSTIVFTEEDANIFEAAIEGDLKILHHEKLMLLRDALGRAPIHICLYTSSTAAIKKFCKGAGNKNNVDSIRDKLFEWTPAHYYNVLHEFDNESQMSEKIQEIRSTKIEIDDYGDSRRRLAKIEIDDKGSSMPQRGFGLLSTDVLTEASSLGCE